MYKNTEYVQKHTTIHDEHKSSKTNMVKDEEDQG